ncbi:MAG: energy-coupling factor transporter transmembrane protein EcfT [Rhodobacteraceae bacterium]|nr:energy-coupling factor transporter transmembrane protein EcfT [Paracoccaceae bacterium]
MLTLTLEQQSWAHRVPVGWKLLVLLLATLVLFPVDHILWLGLSLVAAAILYGSLGLTAMRAGVAMLKPIVLFCAIILAFHVLTGRTGLGFVVVLKILVLVGLANFVTMTSRLDDMMAVVMRLLRPLERLGVNTKAIALAFALVIRFTPVLTSKGTALMEAWRARSPKRAGWWVVIPLVLLALDDADHVADALRARGGLN